MALLEVSRARHNRVPLITYEELRFLDVDYSQEAFLWAQDERLLGKEPSPYPARDKMSKAAQTFTLFPFLPKELRVQIWNYALKPRVVSFHRDRNRGQFPDNRIIKFMALTTLNPSLEIIPRVCAESLVVSQKRYIEWDVWDVRKSVSTTLYDPNNDVVYFSHEFAGNIDPMLLREFATRYPIQTRRMKKLALPAVLSSRTVSGVEILKSLRLFESLSEVVIVLGHAYRKGMVGSIPTPGITRAVMWGERTEGVKNVWVLPDGAQEALETLKREHWPEWKIPKVSVAKFLDDILSV